MTNPRRYLLGPEYPSLTHRERAEGSDKRLAKSRRRFINSAAARSEYFDDLSELIGRRGECKSASTQEMSEWLNGWRMPLDPTRPDVETSHAVFVGYVQSLEMPWLSPLNTGPPYVTITSQFVITCQRVAEAFCAFSALIGSNASPAVVAAARTILFEHLDPAGEPTELVKETISGTKDEIFTHRSCQAAIRWAIAHEMAHAVATKRERQEAYERAAARMKDMERLQWDPFRPQLENAKSTFDHYRDEIACDQLASEYVLSSPFARDDLMTQISGSLVALEALIWEGWFRDRSAVSETHPSPTLRFQLTWRMWLDTLMDRQTWTIRDPLGPLAVQDFAYWLSFEQWAAGAYGSHRRGSVWRGDISLVRRILSHEANLGPDRVYQLTNEAQIRRLDPLI